MAAVTICSDFGAQENKVWHCFHDSSSLVTSLTNVDTVAMAVLKESPVAITEGLLGPVGGDDGEHGIYITSLNPCNTQLREVLFVLLPMLSKLENWDLREVR